MLSSPSHNLPLLYSLSQKKRTDRTTSEAKKTRISFPFRLLPVEPSPRFVRATPGIIFQRLSWESAALRFYPLELVPQFGAVQVDLVARFAALERCKKRVRKVSPGNP